MVNSSGRIPGMTVLRRRSTGTVLVLVLTIIVIVVAVTDLDVDAEDIVGLTAVVCEAVAAFASAEAEQVVDFTSNCVRA